MFIAINIIKDEQIIVNKYPIIFEDINDNNELEKEIRQNENFKEYIKNHIHFSVFNNVSINYVGIVNDYLYEKEIKISDIFDFFDIFSLPDVISEQMIYLYKCVFKKDPNQDYSVTDLYNAILEKHPNKVNITVVANYVASDLKDKHPKLGYKIINEITNKTKEELIK